MNKAELEAKILEANIAYHNTGAPIMSDEEYDALTDQLAAIEPDHLLFRKVGARPMGVTFKHRIPAGSQEKLKDKSAFDRWVEQARSLGLTTFTMGEKLDGLTAVLDYEDGLLVRGLLRGDGFEGEDYTNNIIQMKNVKKKLPDLFTGSLRGEIILSKSDYATYFAPLGYINPRNTAAGVSRDQKGTGLCQHLKIVFFDCIGDDGSVSEEGRLIFMNSLGLETVVTEFFDDPEALWATWLAKADTRNDLDYEIDGVVVRVNNLDIQDEMGMTSDLRPKGQKCLKFEAQGALSRLLGVELTLGSNGAIVPTAKLEPVQIGGVTVSSALLANYNEIARLDIAIGDSVYVTRRGDVIPKVEHVVHRPENRQPIVPPEACIVCGAKTEMVGAYLLCSNDSCVGTEFRRLLKYVTKRGIKYLGEETLTELYENHNIKTPPDLYRITEKLLSGVSRGKGGVVGEGAKAIIAEIDKSRTVQLKDLLGCLALPMLGRRQTEILIGLGIDTLDKFLAATADDLIGLPGFQAAKATAIVDGIQAARPLIEEMARILTLEVASVEAPVAAKSASLQGKIFCFTGKIMKTDDSGNRYTRDMMHAIVLANGGSFTDKITKNTILVQADLTSASSKSKKAQQLGALIMSEADFLKMAGEAI